MVNYVVQCPFYFTIVTCYHSLQILQLFYQQTNSESSQYYHEHPLYAHTQKNIHRWFYSTSNAEFHLQKKSRTSIALNNRHLPHIYIPLEQVFSYGNLFKKR